MTSVSESDTYEHNDAIVGPRKKKRVKRSVVLSLPLARFVLNSSPCISEKSYNFLFIIRL